MNKYVKEFFHRGLLFGGFGPIIMAIVYFVLSYTISDFSLTGQEVFVAVISVYLLTFIHAGVSIFNQIEEWSTAKSLLCHLSSLYVAYVLCYLVNSWIPFDIGFLLVFTLCFVALYLVIWLIVFTIIKITQRRLNGKIK